MVHPRGETTASDARPRARPATEWRPISEAPQDHTRILGRRTYADRYTGVLRYEKHITFWGKTSHVPLYGWNWGRDPENQTLWHPTHWKPLSDGALGRQEHTDEPNGTNQSSSSKGPHQ